MNETEDEIALGIMGNCSENFIGRSAYHLIEMLADGKEGTGNIGMEFARLGMQFGHDRVMKEVLEYVMRREG
jgi:hypothetical protein